jgi:hypothetical protein
LADSDTALGQYLAKSVGTKHEDSFQSTAAGHIRRFPIMIETLGVCKGGYLSGGPSLVTQGALSRR